MKNKLYFDAQKWFSNILYRGLSIEARGLLTDMSSMMNRYGALCIPGTEIVFSREQIFRFSNITAERGDVILDELMNAGLVTLVDDVYKVNTDVFSFPLRRKGKK
jgi:hypothetical protein